MPLLEELGKMADQAVHIRQEYRKLLALLGQLKCGAVLPEQLQIDWLNESWSVTPKESTNGDAPCQPSARPNVVISPATSGLPG